MHHYKQFLLDKNFIPWTDGKIETLKYYLSFDYKVMIKIQTDDESWFIAYLTAADKTYYIVSPDTIRPIDDYTLFKLSERRYVPSLGYTINILELCSD
jgi:hypothetical protein